MIEPLGHRLLIKPLKVEDTDEVFKSARAAGIAGLDELESKERGGIDKGEVIAVGQTAFKDFGSDPWCGVGDVIAYAKYAGKVIADLETKEEFLAINDEDCVARLQKANDD